MRRLNLIPEEVLERRRAQALVRRGVLQIGLVVLVAAVVLSGLERRRDAERRDLQALGLRTGAAESAARAVDSLRSTSAELAAQLDALAALEGRRPVTGLVTLLASHLPAGLRLENLEIAPPPTTQASVAPGQAGYFGMPPAGALQVVLRGTARSADDVAALLRVLEACGRFRRVQLGRLDRPAEGEAAGLGFEVRCDL